ncbi:hypothetical protein KCU94_g57, partial [Aureobasidium melanogenum]
MNRITSESPPKPSDHFHVPLYYSWTKTFRTSFTSLAKPSDFANTRGSSHTSLNPKNFVHTNKFVIIKVTVVASTSFLFSAALLLLVKTSTRALRCNLFSMSFWESLVLASFAKVQCLPCLLNIRFAVYLGTCPLTVYRLTSMKQVVLQSPYRRFQAIEVSNKQAEPTNGSTVLAQTSTEPIRCCHRCALLLLMSLLEPLRCPALHRLSPQTHRHHSSFKRSTQVWQDLFSHSLSDSFSTPPIQSVVILAAHCPQPFAKSRSTSFPDTSYSLPSSASYTSSARSPSRSPFALSTPIPFSLDTSTLPQVYVKDTNRRTYTEQDSRTTHS